MILFPTCLASLAHHFRAQTIPTHPDSDEQPFLLLFTTSLRRKAVEKAYRRSERGNRRVALRCNIQNTDKIFGKDCRAWEIRSGLGKQS
jgi:hypothetical protein